jgi:tRNA(adenine34) deaminase
LHRSSPAFPSLAAKVLRPTDAAVRGSIQKLLARSLQQRKDLPVDHERFMQLALAQAEEAGAADEAPVGALIVRKGRVIATARNEREALLDPTAHAEMIAITQAAAALGSWRLADCTLYVTLEPCPMCAGAIVQARIPLVVYGAADPKAGAVRSLFRLIDDARLNHRAEVVAGVMAEPCGQILTEYFRRKRRSPND